MITAIMVGRLVASLAGHAVQIGPGVVFSGLGMVVAALVAAPVAWRGRADERERLGLAG